MLERVKLAARVLTGKASPENFLVGIGRGQGELPKLGTRALLQGYAQFPWLRAIVGKAAEIAAGVEWVVSTTRGGETVIVENHPLQSFFMDGNEVHSGISLRHLMFVHMLLAGENFWGLERNRAGMPIHPWTVPPSWMAEVPILPLQGQYRMSFRGLNITLPGTEVAYFRELDAENPYGRGSGKGLVAGDELQTDEYASKFLGAFFLNHARPDLLISAKSADRPIDPLGVRKLEESWVEKLQGFARAFRPFFVQGGPIEVHDLGSSFPKEEVPDLRRFSRDTLMQLYGFPPEALGVLETSNRATITAAEFFLTKHVIVPKLKLIRDSAQARLVPEFDERLRLDFISPIEEDREHQLAVMKEFPWAFYADEFRNLGLHPPLADDTGRVHFVPFAGTLQTELRPLAPGDDSEGRAPRRLGARKRAVTGSDVDMLLVRLDSGALRRTVWDATERALGDAIDTVGEATLAEVGADVAWTRTDAVRQHLTDWGVERAKGLDQTTKEQLGALLGESVADGDDLQGVIGSIQGYFAEVGPRRARTIAQTELTRSLGFTQEEAFAQAGVPRKMWLSTRDSAVRDAHAGLDGEVKDRGVAFEAEGSRAQHPGDFGVPSLDINCRCALQPVLPGTRTFTEEEREALWRAKDADRIPLERAVRRQVREAFGAQAEILSERIREIMAE